MSFFTSKIVSIGEKINVILLTFITDVSSSSAALEVSFESDLYLNCFCRSVWANNSNSLFQTINLCFRPNFNQTVQGFKEVFPLINTSILDLINLSLLTGYAPHSFKVAVTKPLLEKPTLDQGVLANYRPISNLRFMYKVLRKLLQLNFVIIYTEVICLKSFSQHSECIIAQKQHW